MQYSRLVVNCTITWTEKSTVVLLHHNIALHWLATALLGRIETDESRWRRFFNLPQNRKNSNFKKLTFHGIFIIILIINTVSLRCLQRFFYFFYYLHSVLYQHKTVFSEFWLPTYLTITNSSTPPNYLGLQQYTKIVPNNPKFRVSVLKSTSAWKKVSAIAITGKRYR